METIVLAGGCFWCLEAVFSRLRGVASVVSGYANGHVPAPSYDQVCRGDSGHAEAVTLRFDPGVLSLAAVLTVFFAAHDPTTPNRQGNDVGSQYRSGIYCTSVAQQQAVARWMNDLTWDANWQGSAVVTEVAPLSGFWPAEDEHQRYYQRHSRQPYCALVIAPKLDKLERAHRDWLVR